MHNALRLTTESLKREQAKAERLALDLADAREANRGLLEWRDKAQLDMGAKRDEINKLRAALVEASKFLKDMPFSGIGWHNKAVDVWEIIERALNGESEHDDE